MDSKKLFLGCLYKDNGKYTRKAWTQEKRTLEMKKNLLVEQIKCHFLISIFIMVETWAMCKTESFCI